MDHQVRHPVIETIRAIVERCGYSFEYRLFQEQFEHVENLIAECREKDVKGISIMAGERKVRYLSFFRILDTDCNRR